MFLLISIVEMLFYRASFKLKNLVMKNYMTGMGKVT